MRGGEEIAIIDFSIRPVTDESGAVTMLTPEGRDITKRKRHEREKQRLDEFASIVSLDLRNPLNVASGRLDLVRDECDSPHLEHIEQVHERMEMLIEDLLTLARGGVHIDEREVVDLAKLVESCWRTVDTRAARIVIESEREVHADRSRFQPLLENLLRNAVDHGGDDVTVTIGDLEGGFFVADDGTGIDPAVHDEIFESGVSTSDEGTGFGLSFAREIASALGWTVTATGAEGGGARFEVTGLD